MKFRNLNIYLKNLVEYLVIISSTAENQNRYVGIGHPALEMPEYLLFPDGWKDDNIKIKKAKLIEGELLEEIESCLKQLSKEDEDFWYQYDKSDSQKWDDYRMKAEKLISKLGLESLEIITEFKREKDKSGGVRESSKLFLVIEKNHTSDDLNAALKVDEIEER